MGHDVTADHRKGDRDLPDGMHLIDGPIQHYPWGDTEFLPRFLHREPDGRPWAEWWLGTHPHGPAQVRGAGLLEEISGPLPYLVKVLAAAQPLSLQIHPNAAQALQGHRTGRYVDPHPKPELIHALTEFEAFCGIRPVVETLSLLDRHGLTDLALDLRTRGIAETMRRILTGEFDPASTVRICHDLASKKRTEGVDPSIAWVSRLDRIYPGDPAVVATLLLHHLQLRPGQALRLTAGTLHAYLRGAGIEVMGPSDNVVRCGLTSKPVDIAGVVAILDPTEVIHPVLAANTPHRLPELGIRLWELPAGQKHIAATALIAVAADGKGYFIEAGTEIQMPVACHLIGAESPEMTTS
jgi:mannose-6-phosphate isomerase